MPLPATTECISVWARPLPFPKLRFAGRAESCRRSTTSRPTSDWKSENRKSRFVSGRRDADFLLHRFLTFLIFGLHLLVGLQHLACQVPVAVGLVGTTQLIVQASVLINR